MEKYIPALEMVGLSYGRRWIAVTLTGYLIPREAVGVNVDIFAQQARAFLKERFQGGLIVIEHTTKTDGYYIHAHALCLGDFQNQTDFEYEWGCYLLEQELITFDEFRAGRDAAIEQAQNAGKHKRLSELQKVDGIRFCWLQDMRWSPNGKLRSNHDTVRAGLAYLLKYVTKGVALEDHELEQVKGLRYISTFGELYNMRLPVWKNVCKFCGKSVALGYPQDIDIIERDKMAKGEEPLELKRVISWPVRQPKMKPGEWEETQNRLKEYVKRKWEGVALPCGLNLLMRWLLDRPGRAVSESVVGYV